MKNKALLIVDVQNDFCPGGALPVPQGDEVVAVLNTYIQHFTDQQLPVFASRDWHPAKTSHFKAFGGLWPVHCVQETAGAAFHPDLKLPAETVVISKGMDPEQDSYSAFQGFDQKGRVFAGLLKEAEIKELFVGGLATDYCVKSSCLDALQQGLRVYLLKDAIRGVNVNPDDSDKAIAEMRAQGAKEITYEQLTNSLIEKD